MWAQHPSFLWSEFILVFLISIVPHLKIFILSAAQEQRRKIHTSKHPCGKGTGKSSRAAKKGFSSIFPDQVSPKEGAQCCGWHSHGWHSHGWHSRGALLEQDKDTCAGLGTAQCSEIRESSSPGRDGSKETTHRTHRASAVARRRNGNRICFSHGLGTMWILSHTLLVKHFGTPVHLDSSIILQGLLLGC